MVSATAQTQMIRPVGLYPGARFAVPVLVGQRTGLMWWTVHRVMGLAGARVRLVLEQADHRGRRYRVELAAEDRVVWSLVPHRRPVPLSPLGHHVWCNRCGLTWGYLPVTVSNAPCYRCARTVGASF